MISSTARVPAWKLRQLKKEERSCVGLPPALKSDSKKEEQPCARLPPALMSDLRRQKKEERKCIELPPAPKSSGEVYITSSPTSVAMPPTVKNSMPAWKLRLLKKKNTGGLEFDDSCNSSGILDDEILDDQDESNSNSIMDDGDSFSLLIRCQSSGETLRINAKPSDTISSCKHKISRMWQIPVSDIRLAVSFERGGGIGSKVYAQHGESTTQTVELDTYSIDSTSTSTDDDDNEDLFFHQQTLESLGLAAACMNPPRSQWGMFEPVLEPCLVLLPL